MTTINPIVREVRRFLRDEYGVTETELSQGGGERPRLAFDYAGFLNVTLPGELVRSTIEKVLSRDVALARIKSIVTHKAVHGFQQNSLVAVQRTQGELGERWTPVEEREVKEREEREKAARAARASEGEAHQEEAPVRKAKAKYIGRRGGGIATYLIEMPNPCIDDGGDHLIDKDENGQICCSCQKRQKKVLVDPTA